MRKNNKVVLYSFFFLFGCSLMGIGYDVKLAFLGVTGFGFFFLGFAGLIMSLAD